MLKSFIYIMLSPIFLQCETRTRNNYISHWRKWNRQRGAIQIQGWARAHSNGPPHHSLWWLLFQLEAFSLQAKGECTRFLSQSYHDVYLPSTDAKTKNGLDSIIYEIYIWNYEELIWMPDMWWRHTTQVLWSVWCFIIDFHSTCTAIFIALCCLIDITISPGWCTISFCWSCPGELRSSICKPWTRYLRWSFTHFILSHQQHWDSLFGWRTWP